jgi:hypothetical protein
MRANRGRKFKAPRLLRAKETAKQSESDEDDIPFSAIREKVRAETKGSDSEEDNIPFSQIKTKTTISTGNTRKDRPSPGRVNSIRLLSEREADETAKYGEVQTWSDDDGDKAGRVPLSYLRESLKKDPRTSWTEDDVEDPNKKVGSQIARDFGERGIYLGEVIRIEYDSDDEDKVCIQTNGSP